MNTDAVRIVGIGLVCAAGTGLFPASAALASGDFTIRRHPGWFNRNYKRQICSWVTDPTAPRPLSARLAMLAGAAQDDLLRMTGQTSGKADRMALLLPGPGSAGAEAPQLAEAAGQILNQLQAGFAPFDPPAPAIVPADGASAGLAQVIAALLADPHWRSAVVLAVDSLVPQPRLVALDTESRLFCDQNPWGVIPSEAAVAIWLHRDGPAFLPELSAATWTEEPIGPDDGGAPLFRGMSDALNAAIDAHGLRQPPVIDEIWGDSGNGRYHASEQAHALIRASGSLMHGAPLTNPCRVLGDCGAAGMAVALALALAQPGAGPTAAVLGTSNTAGLRGALIVTRPPALQSA